MKIIDISSGEMLKKILKPAAAELYRVSQKNGVTRMKVLHIFR